MQTNILRLLTWGSCFAISPPTNTASRYIHKFCTVIHCSIISLVPLNLFTHNWILGLNGVLYLDKNKYNFTSLIFCIRREFLAYETKFFCTFSFLGKCLNFFSLKLSTWTFTLRDGFCTYICPCTFCCIFTCCSTAKLESLGYPPVTSQSPGHLDLWAKVHLWF